jgi:hypothetical protein
MSDSAGSGNNSLYAYLIELENLKSQRAEEEAERVRVRKELEKSDATMQDIMKVLDEVKARQTLDAAAAAKNNQQQGDMLFSAANESKFEAMIARIAKRTFFDESQKLPMLNKNNLSDSISKLYENHYDPAQAVGNLARMTLLAVLDVLFFRRPVEMLERLADIDVLKLFRDLPKYCIISTSGDHGPDGTDGMDGREGGGDGTSGVPGQLGSPAKPNVVSLVSVPGQDVFIVSPKDEGSNPYIMRLYDGNVSVNLYALVSWPRSLSAVYVHYLLCLTGWTRRKGRKWWEWRQGQWWRPISTSVWRSISSVCTRSCDILYFITLHAGVISK